MFRNIVLLGTTLACSSLFGSNLYFTDAVGLVAYDSAFRGNFAFNSSASSFTQNPDPSLSPVLVQSYSSNANLTAGTLRNTSSVSNNGQDSNLSTGFANVITAFGDTITYTGTASGGRNITANVGISGSISTAVTGSATEQNFSYLEVDFLKPGSFDSGNIQAPANIISRTRYGIGPNALPNPGFSSSDYSGFFYTLPAQFSIPVDISLLPSGFQTSVVLQTEVSGDTGNTGTFSSAVDLGHTINVSLQAPSGITLTSAGGLPITTATPEPMTMLLSAAGVGALLLRRKLHSRGSAPLR